MKKILLLCSFFCLSLFTINAQEIINQYSDNTLRIVSYNIRNGMGMDEITNYARTIKTIKGLSPDVVAVQEVDSMTERSNKVDVLKVLAGGTRMYGTYGWAISYQGGKYGIGILSKERPIHTQRIALPGREEERVLLIAEFDNYVFCCIHLSLTTEDSEASVDIINKYVSHYDKPVILAGDFNSGPDSETMKAFENNWKMLSTADEPTYPASDPEDRIDYILGYTGKMDRKTYSVSQSIVVDEPFASDHRPIFVGVKLNLQTPIIVPTGSCLPKPMVDADDNIKTK